MDISNMLKKCVQKFFSLNLTILNKLVIGEHAGAILEYDIADATGYRIHHHRSRGPQGQHFVFSVVVSELE